MTIVDDGALTGTAKALLPQPVKDLAELGIRRLTQATAPLRPPPDLLVVGTKRGGTTFLWSALQSHPQVMPMVPKAKHLKSCHYFYEHFERGPAWYLGHFPTRWSRRRHAARYGHALCLEASPMYLFDPRVADRVASSLPRARVVILLRDPVRRAFSHYQERRKAGVETLSFPEALRVEDRRLAGEESRMNGDPGYYSRAWDWYSYRTRGEYAGQVQRWFDALGRHRVLVVRSEDLYSDPTRTLDLVQQFAGLTPVDLPGRKRNGSGRAERIDPISESVLRTHFASHNRRLAALLDDEVWWP
jgi:hypothetical protein